MNGEEQSGEKPSFEEIVAGKDVSIGKEIVENLTSEDIGIPVYKIITTQAKTKVVIDREPGEEDYQIRKRREVPKNLLGIAVPTENEEEFIYFGIEEQGFVFNTKKENLQTQFNPEINRAYYLARDKLVEAFSEIYSREINITLKEDESPEEFNRVFAASVEKQREKVKRIKARRAEARKNLKQGLFGKKD